MPLLVGVYPRETPTDMYREFLPLVEYLSRATGLPMDLRVAPGYEEALQWIRGGEVDFLHSGPASYGSLLLGPERPELPLVATEMWDGEALVHGRIFVRESSPIRTLADLRGHSFAFPDANSTMALLARKTIENAGVSLSDLSRREHLHGHDDVALAVANGEFDAGACKASTAEKYRPRGLRFLDVDLSGPGRPIFARVGLDPGHIAAVRASLLALTLANEEHARILRGIEKKLTGFAVGDPKTYVEFARAVGETRP